MRKLQSASGTLLCKRLALGCALLLSAFVSQALAETYPSRPVTFVVPFSAGSITDTVARSIANDMQKALGQPFVIDNKPGAQGMIAATHVARSAPNGYTLFFSGNSTQSAAPGLFKNVPYDPIKDFVPVARIAGFPSFIAVNPSSPIKSIGELVAYAKAHPGQLSYGHGNSSGQVAIETFKKRLGLDIVRVGYRGNPMALTDLMAGNIVMAVPDFGTGLPQVQGHKIRPLAVLTKSRNSTLPDIPTLNETVLPGFDLIAWTGIFAPAGTPPEIVNTLANEVEKILAKPEIKKQFTSLGLDVFWAGPQEYQHYVKTELDKWTGMIKESGIEPE